MKKSRFFSVLLFVSLLFVLLPATAKAIWDVPVGPGESFRWVFVTSERTVGTISEIDYYNNDFINDFVMGDYPDTPIPGLVGKDNLADIIWYAIASTEEVDAIDNIGGHTSAPIYDPVGHRIENSTVAMTDGSLLYPLMSNEYGDFHTTPIVWTGTLMDFTGNPGYTLGCDLVVVGALFDSRPGGWINFDCLDPLDIVYPIYAISEVLTVPALIPAPGALMLATTGLLSMLGLKRLRRKHQE